MNSDMLLIVGCLNREAPYMPNADGNGIAVFAFDDATGQGALLSQTDDIDNPTYLSVSSDGGTLFATSEVFNRKEGLAVAYGLDRATGTLTYRNMQSTQGSIAAYNAVSADGRFLFVANYAMGRGGPDRSLVVLPILGDGSLGPAVVGVTHEGAGPDADRQERSHAHCVQQVGDVLLVTDLGIDRVIAYRLEDDGGLERLGETVLAPGAGPRHITANADGTSVFVINELASTVQSFRHDGAGGLTPVTKRPAVPDGVSDSHCAALHLSPDGLFLYASNRGHDSIAIFAVDPVTADLTVQGHVPTGGTTPRSFAVSPSGRHLLSANQTADEIVVFRRDPDTGGLRETGTRLKMHADDPRGDFPMTTLRGMTWSHPRGYDPMVACSADWASRGGATVEWDKRSLQDFESYPVEQLARAYDLIVIDHPHVGQITAEGCLVPLPDAPDITGSSAGRSVSSYDWTGSCWAWPIDAATQVQAIRPDLIEGPARDWDAVLDLARAGRVMVPLRAPHALMCFYTLVANDGFACRNDGPGALVDRAAGRRALERLRALAALIDPVAYEMDPIAVLDRMGEEEIACAPLIYGYVSYAGPGFRRNRIAFHDIASVTPGGGVAGSALGGTGIAVSAFSKDPEAAIAFARHVAGPAVQRERYVQAGGQAGHRAAWTDAGVDRAAGGFYSGTLATLDGAWLRPRHDGYMAFQGPASERISEALRDGDLNGALDDLQRLFDASFKR